MVTSRGKLEEWKQLFEMWTCLKPLVFDDQEGKEGLEKLKEWDMYHDDVLTRGIFTQRNKILKYDVLITVESNCSDEFLVQVPVHQVIVDQAEIKSHREATRNIACKRIILITSKSMMQGPNELVELLDTIVPVEILTQIPMF